MKIASRYLLPLELYLATTMIGWGLSGWLGKGGLWVALQANGQNLEWGSVMVAVGTSQLFAGVGEWRLGRDWCQRKLLLSVSNRSVCAALSTVIWFYACYKILTLAGMNNVVSLWIQAPVAAVFSAWVFIGNMKVRHILHPDVPTSRLEQTIIIDRRRITKG